MGAEGPPGANRDHTTYQAHVRRVRALEAAVGEKTRISSFGERLLSRVPIALTVFQPFTQADASTTRKFGGSGLGLVISKRLAGLLGGDVAVETRQGTGTRMRATVAAGPLDGVKMVQDPLAATVLVPDRADAAANRDGQTLPGCHILLAEDGPDNQRLIAYVLEKAGADVTVVENGKLAVDAALAECDQRPGAPEFHVILMDMQMPALDGYEATRLLRRKGYTRPIIALTAQAMSGDRNKCIDAGCNEYATKPIDQRKLIETIRRRIGAGLLVEAPT